MSNRKSMGHLFFQTIPTKVLPRYCGIMRFMGLTHIECNDSRISNIDIEFIGVSVDNGGRKARACDMGRNRVANQTYRFDVESMFV